MKLSSGKRIGQSGQELVTATIFSFVLHALTLAAAVFLYFTGSPKIYIPPFYSVKLVNLSADVSPVQPSGAPSALPKPETKPPEKGKKVHVKERKTAAKTTKGAMPELAKPKQRQAIPEEESAAERPPERQVASLPPSGAGATPGVSMSIPQDFKFPPYLGIVREKIGVNWNPPPGALDTRVKIQFTILRSGRVGDVKLTESSGNFYFDQAAVRAILASSPFPALPDGFYKEYEVFSVDLMEKQ